MIDPSYQDYCNANYGPEDIQHYETCSKCMGSGYSNHPDSGEVCESCGGQGEIERTLTVVDVGDELHQILGEALAAVSK